MSDTLFLVDGKAYRLCTCPSLSGKCAQGGERKLGTTELSRCLIPAPDAIFTQTDVPALRQADTVHGDEPAAAAPSEEGMGLIELLEARAEVLTRTCPGDSELMHRAAEALTRPASPTGKPVLPCELVVGAGRFHAGIKVSTVQGAIDRMFGYLLAFETDNKKLAARVKELSAAPLEVPLGKVGDFIYLLNAFEQASQSVEPAKNEYGKKRRAILEYVAALQRSGGQWCPSSIKEAQDMIAACNMYIGLYISSEVCGDPVVARSGKASAPSLEATCLTIQKAVSDYTRRTPPHLRDCDVLTGHIVRALRGDEPAVAAPISDELRQCSCGYPNTPCTRTRTDCVMVKP